MAEILSPFLLAFYWKRSSFILNFILEYINGGGYMNKVKITVLKTTFDEQLAEEYGVKGLTACPMLKEGQVFYADYAKPEGFCDEAWKAIYQYVFALAHGAGNELFYYGDWIRKKVWQSAAAMTGSVRSFSSWKRLTRLRRSTIPRFDKENNQCSHWKSVETKRRKTGKRFLKLRFPYFKNMASKM